MAKDSTILDTGNPLTIHPMMPDYGVRLVGWTRFGKGSQVSEERDEDGKSWSWTTYRNSHVVSSTLLDKKTQGAFDLDRPPIHHIQQD